MDLLRDFITWLDTALSGGAHVRGDVVDASHAWDAPHPGDPGLSPTMAWIG